MAIPEKSEAIWSDFVYDIETFQNIFCMDITHVATGTRWIFEVSERVNQSEKLVKFLEWLRDNSFRMVGYNNEGFDYLILHHLISIFRQTGTFSCTDAYEKTKFLFALEWNDRFNHMVWANERLVPQLDLFKVHHFDNVARSTSLKKLEIAMRSWSVQDLPYDPDKPLSYAEMDKLIEYMCHDVRETINFYLHSLAQIKFRDEISVKYGKDFTNANDTKIGKEFFKMELEKHMPGCTGTSGNPKQTRRERIVISDIILPYVQFQHTEFNRILEFFKTSSIKCDSKGVAQLKGFFEKLNCTVNDMCFHFGAGGLHASVSGLKFAADDDYEIIDVDVTSYYPSLAIANGLFPMHLSSQFCTIYKSVFEMRMSYDKKTAESAMLKLALNGVYGDSNNKHSPFFDPQYTMAITVNGQLLMAMLAEQVMSLQGVSLIQANTDGITCRVHKSVKAAFMQICEAWEATTDLNLEYVNYDRMFVRDVNNYIGDYGKGKLKRIGAYAHLTPLEDPYTREVQWHKNHSSLIVPKAAEAALVCGEDPAEFIDQCTDPFLFMRSVKVPKNYQLMSVPGWRTDKEAVIDSQGQQVFDAKGKPKITNVKYPVGEITKYQGTSRYFVSTDGVELTKHMPPLPSKPNRQRYNSIDSGYRVTMCNDVRDFNWASLNKQFYLDEAMKLITAIN